MAHLILHACHICFQPNEKTVVVFVSGSFDSLESGFQSQSKPCQQHLFQEWKINWCIICFRKNSWYWHLYSEIRNYSVHFMNHEDRPFCIYKFRQSSPGCLQNLNNRNLKNDLSSPWSGIEGPYAVIHKILLKMVKKLTMLWQFNWSGQPKSGILPSLIVNLKVPVGFTVQ